MATMTSQTVRMPYCTIASSEPLLRLLRFVRPRYRSGRARLRMTQPPDSCSKIHYASWQSGRIYTPYCDETHRLVFAIEGAESPHA